MSFISIKVDDSDLTEKQLDFLAKCSSPEVRRHISEMLIPFINQYVPAQSGELRRSARATARGITWGNEDIAYAHYQYEGDIYKPNLPITEKGSGKNGTIVGWYTPEGTTKHRSGEKMGDRHEWRGWTFGYTDPNTRHHWIAEWWDAGGANRRIPMIRITNYLKRVLAGKE